MGGLAARGTEAETGFHREWIGRAERNGGSIGNGWAYAARNSGSIGNGRREVARESASISNGKTKPVRSAASIANGTSSLLGNPVPSRMEAGTQTGNGTPFQMEPGNRSARACGKGITAEAAAESDRTALSVGIAGPAHGRPSSAWFRRCDSAAPETVARCAARSWEW